jgi:hypothetical protein
MPATKRGRDVALHFEQMRSVFGTLMTKAHVNLASPSADRGLSKHQRDAANGAYF